MSQGLSGWALLAAVGLHAAVIMTAGLIIAGLSPLIDAPLRPLNLARLAWRRAWPRRGEGLHERTVAVASLWVLTLSLPLCVRLLRGGYERLFIHVQRPELAALGAALLGVAFVAAFYALAIPVTLGASRALEWLVRRSPRLTPLAAPALSAILVAVLLIGWLLQQLRAGAALFSVTELRAQAMLLSALALLLLGGGYLSERLPRWRWGLELIGLLAALPLLGWMGLSLLERPGVVEILGAEASATNRPLLEALWAPFDKDEDGYADRLGGGDCDDHAPTIYPGAVEIPDNRVDEDCDGRDLKAPPPPPPPPPPQSPLRARLAPPYDVILITIANLRADHLGLYGYGRPTSPALDAFGAECFVFRAAYAPSGEAHYSLPALITGRYPSELIRDQRQHPSYSAENQTLAELLSELGYHAAGFPSHGLFAPRRGLGQGFAVWRPFIRPPAEMARVETSGAVITAALAHLKDRDQESRPLHLWLHLYDPDGAHIRHPDTPDFGADPIARYDHEIRYTDEWLGYLIESLRFTPRWGKTILVITSPGGPWLPSPSGPAATPDPLAEGRLRVPLLIRVPRLPGKLITEPVSLVGILPTLLDLVGVDASASLRVQLRLPSRSLLPTMLQEAAPPAPIFAEIPATPGRPQRMAFVEEGWKLRYSGIGGRYALFDLRADPLEREDLSLRHPEKAEALRAALQGLRARLEVRRPMP